jgi:hypothetical protein
MKNSNSKVATKGSKNATKNSAKQNVKDTNNSPKRVIETRDAWEVIFNHSVALIAAYAKGIKVEKPREGFEKAFGSAASSPNSRGYAKSLIWGFATNKAGKVLKNLDDVATKASREKIALAILTDCKLVKGDDKAVQSQLTKVETKREKAVAEAVLKELTKPEPKKPTTKGGKGGKKSETKKATTPKGGSSKSESSKPATKGGKKSSTKASK